MAPNPTPPRDMNMELHCDLAAATATVEELRRQVDGLQVAKAADGAAEDKAGEGRGGGGLKTTAAGAAADVRDVKAQAPASWRDLPRKRKRDRVRSLFRAAAVWRR